MPGSPHFADDSALDPYAEDETLDEIEYVIVNANGEFLTDHDTWAVEYPEAQIFFDESVALERAERTAGAAEVVADYGFADEAVVWRAHRACEDSPSP